MTNRWLNLLETHVEKGILGLAAFFMLFMLWAYLIRSPNKVSYGGREVGPRALAEAIKQETKATIRVLPDEEFRSSPAPSDCVWCGKKAVTEAVWARAY